MTCLLALCAGPAAAQDAGYYAKVFGGLSALQGDAATLDGTTGPVNYDTGALFGGAIGYDYGDRPFRAELEFAYRSGDAEAFGGTGDYASTTLMLNGVYVFQTGGAFRPYVGLGLGYVTEIDFDIADGPETGEYSDRGLLAWQAMIGSDYALSDSLSLFGEARFFRAESPSLSGPGGASLSADYDTFDLVAGLTLRF
jgi:opacity protein-like surface antigen